MSLIMTRSNRLTDITRRDMPSFGEAAIHPPQATLQQKSVMKILVGSERVQFELSAKALQRSMPSISAALDGLNEEERHNTLLLPQVDPKVFEFFSEWALTKEIEVPENNGGTNSFIFWSTLSNVYALAQEVKATDLKRYIIDTIYASIRDDGYGPNATVIRSIYGQTSGGSGVRRIVVAFFVWQAAESWWNVDTSVDDKDDWTFKDMPTDFQTEVGIAALERIHLMDDGNPFNDADETEETGFGPEYFYEEEDKTFTGSQKWLRNDPHGLRAEEEWDAARFEVVKETDQDRAMINDDEEALKREEVDAMNLSEPDETGDSWDSDSDDSEEQPQACDTLNVHIKPSGFGNALDLRSTMSSKAKKMFDFCVSLAVTVMTQETGPMTMEEWSMELEMSMRKVKRAAEELSDLGIFKYYYEVVACDCDDSDDTPLSSD